MNILEHFAFRGRPRVYGTTELLGYEALVVRDDGSAVTLVTHDLYAFETRRVSRAEFLEGFVPDLSSTPARMATDMRSWFHNIRADDESRSAVERALNRPGKLEDLKVKKTNNKKATAAHVCHDFNRRTCIVLERTENLVVYLPMNGEGLEVLTAAPGHFDKDYKPLDGYPVEKAAALYVEYARHLGATKEAMAELGKLVTVTQADVGAALRQRAAADAKRPTAPPTTTEEKPKKERTAAKGVRPVVRVKQDDPPWDTGKAKPKAEVATTTKTGKPRAEGVGTFCERLILEGKSNEEVLAAAKKQFPDKNPSPSSVNWYRNKLKREGKL